MEQTQEKKIYTLEELKKLSLQELQKIGRELELSRVTGLRKEELIEKILSVQAKEEGLLVFFIIYPS